MRLYLQFLALLPLFLPAVSKHFLLRSLMPCFLLVLVFYPPTLYALAQTSPSSAICGMLDLIPELPKQAAPPASNFPSSREKPHFGVGYRSLRTITIMWARSLPTSRSVTLPLAQNTACTNNSGCDEPRHAEPSGIAHLPAPCRAPTRAMP